MKDPNEKRALTAIVLSMAVIWVWTAFFSPPPVPPAPPAEVAQSATPALAAGEVVPSVPSPEVPAVAEAPCTGQETRLASSTVTLVATDCGALRGVLMEGVPAAVHVTPWWTWAIGRVTGSAEGPWEPYGADRGTENVLSGKGDMLAVGRGDRVPDGTWTVVSADPLVQRRVSPEGYTVTRTISRGAASDLWDVAVRIEAARSVEGPFWVGVVDEVAPPTGAYSSVAKLEGVVDGGLEELMDVSDATERFEGPVSWFGVGDKYYLAALLPQDPASGTMEWAKADEGRAGVYFVSGTPSLEAGKALDLAFTMYTGPKEVGRLNELGHDLGEAASLGIFGFFGKILLFTLHMFQGVLENWGASILALTFLVRLALYPLTRKAVVAGRKMQVLQPQMKALQEKYADDKEALNRETMALFSKNGVNPLGGCMPILFQMPVFFALYAAISYEPALFHADFLYLQDLSAPDPYGILGVLIVVGMYVQQLMTPMTGMDPTQAQMMKLMPLVFGFMMFSMPSGLSLYYTLNTVLAIVQQWYNTRSIPAIPTGEVHVSS